MRLAKNVFYFSFFIAFIFIYSTIISGCAQIGAPTGGAKDTLPPVFIGAIPPDKSVNFSGNKIVLTFNEYVDIDNIQNNLLVSPYPKSNPSISNKLKTVTIKLKDTLLDNTTYAINFGNAIKDVNEGNIIKNFTFVFSTGSTIDSLKLSGNVLIAETGKVDSTLLVLLYRNANDSSVQQKKPNYIARLNGKGNFTFHNLPPGNFRIYALKDEDGSKTYNSKFEEIAFADSDINTSLATGKIQLYAFAEEKEAKKGTITNTSTVGKHKNDKQSKKFKYSSSVSTASQDLLSPLEIDFSQQLKNLDSQKIVLSDTSYNPIANTLTVDSTRKKIFIQPKWTENTNYRLVIDTNAVSDSADERLAKIDTVKFRTKGENEYGTLLLHFKNIDYTKHPVLLLLQADAIVKSIPIKVAEWSDKLILPGEYELRILYDDNNNGKWDPGSFLEKRQPEKVISLDKKLTIKADWDNERDIEL